MKELPGILTLVFDGGCWPNPGGDPTYGYIITTREGEILREGKGKVENPSAKTNNVAEYHGLITALGVLKEAGWRGDLLIKSDSKLVVEQIRGVFACRAEHLRSLRDRASGLIEEVANLLDIQWMGRDGNKICDGLARSAR